MAWIITTLLFLGLHGLLMSSPWRGHIELLLAGITIVVLWWVDSGRRGVLIASARRLSRERDASPAVPRSVEVA